VPESPASTGDPPALARRSPTLFWLFSLYLRWYFYRSFHAVRISRGGLPPVLGDRPLIVYSNHPSWWDPAVYILLGSKLFPGRVGFGPMDSRALGRYGVLQRMGVFGVPQNDPRGAAIFLRTSLAALARPRAMLWLTAEGAFTDHRTRPVVLRPGLAHLVRRVPEAIILPLALEYSFWNESRAEVLTRFGAPLETCLDKAGLDNSVAAWNQRLEAALTDTMDALAIESRTRNPNLFQPLLRGGAGVGGLYDAWRHLRAARAGRRFDPSHGGEP
jgi:1-acyl-sn-glycerol-3-phosphate acyltransferase